MIERIEEVQREVWAGGIPRRQDFRLRLAAYGDEEEAETAAAGPAPLDDAGDGAPDLQADGAALQGVRRNIAAVLERAPSISTVAPDLAENARVVDGIARVWRQALAAQVRTRVERRLPRSGRAGAIAATVLRSVDGDVLDGMVWRHYGRVPGAVEQVLDANPGLADLGPALPPGTKIRLPGGAAL